MLSLLHSSPKVPLNVSCSARRYFFFLEAKKLEILMHFGQTVLLRNFFWIRKYNPPSIIIGDVHCSHCTMMQGCDWAVEMQHNNSHNKSWAQLEGTYYHVWEAVLGPPAVGQQHPWSIKSTGAKPTD